MQHEWPEEAILAYRMAQAQSRALPPVMTRKLYPQAKPLPSETPEWSAWKSYLRQKGAVKGYQARYAAWQARLNQAGIPL